MSHSPLPSRCRSRRPALLIALALWVNSLTVPLAAAQEPPDTIGVTVIGNALNEATADPVEGAIVVVEPLGLTLVTDDHGQFVLDGIVPGSYSLQLIHRDYLRMEGDLAVDQPGEFFLAMTPSGDPTDGMMTGIVGQVTDQATGQPIPDVVVNVAEAGRVATTTRDGFFSMPHVPAGRHEVAFTHLGFRARTVSVDVHPNHVADLDIALSVEAIELDAIEVTIERRDRHLQEMGFYEREEEGWGDFIDREELEDSNPIWLTFALARFPGVTIVPNPERLGQQVLALRRLGNTCFPTVYLDGIRIGIGRDPAGIDDLVIPSEVAGVEVYRNQAGIPPQYWGTGSSCGVVLIWLRRGR